MATLDDESTVVGAFYRSTHKQRVLTMAMFLLVLLLLLEQPRTSQATNDRQPQPRHRTSLLDAQPDILIIYASSNTSNSSCTSSNQSQQHQQQQQQQGCGVSEDCPCGSIRAALAQAFDLQQQASSMAHDDDAAAAPITIELVLLPGVYSGSDNQNLSITIDHLAIRSQGGYEQTTIAYSGVPVFVVRNANDLLISGLSITQQAPTLKSAISITDAEGVVLADMRIYNTSRSWSTIEIVSSNVTFVNCSILNNEATEGAILIASSVVSIRDSLLEGNQALRLISATRSAVSVLGSSVLQNTGAIECMGIPALDGGEPDHSHDSPRLSDDILFAFRNSVCLNNTGARAACVFVGGGRQVALISDSRFSSIRAPAFGPDGLVVVVNTPVSMYNCSFSDFRSVTQDAAALVLKAESNSGSQRNYVYLASLQRVSFTNILSLRGAPLYALGVSLQLKNSSFSGNHGQNAGAIKFADMLSSFSDREFVAPTELTIDASHFTNNVATEAGALLIRSNRDVNITHCVFANNTADHDGGALLFLPLVAVTQPQRVLIHGVTFSNNQARYGGAMHLSGIRCAEARSMTISHSHFEYNSARTGGGVHVQELSPVFERVDFLHNLALEGDGGGAALAKCSRASFQACTFRNCSADSFGGALSALMQHSALAISDTIFTGNYAASGGALALSESDTLPLARIYVNRCRFEQNRASFGGALCALDQADPIISNSDFVDNLGTAKGGGAFLTSRAAPSFTNCSWSGNTATLGGALSLEQYVGGSLDNCTIENNYSMSPGGGIAIHNFVNSTFRNCTIISNRAISTGGGGIAIRDEATPTFYGCRVSNNSCDSSGGGIAVTRTSKPCFYGGEITANFAKSFGGGVYAGDESQALFDQVDISNNECLNDGGGLFLSDASAPTLNDCTLVNNSAVSSGGALAIQAASRPNLNSVLFAYNRAGNEGGSMSIHNRANPMFFNCSFAHNRAVSGGGAGVLTDISNSTFYQCTFVDNSSGSRGGALYMSGTGQATFVECDFSANNASNAGQGGAIAISDSSVMQMMSCNLTSNIAQLGGGLYSESDRIQSVVASLFSRNRGVLSGGAICVSRHARVAVNDSTIRMNEGFDGGAIAVQDIGTIALERVHLHHNGALQNGGGIVVSSGGTAIVVSTNLTQNAAGRGGGLMAQRYSSILLQRVEITENFAQLGGGMMLEGDILVAERLRVVNNVAWHDGGGLAIQTTGDWMYHPQFSDTTFEFNTAPFGHGGGIYITNLDVCLNSPKHSHSKVNEDEWLAITAHPFKDSFDPMGFTFTNATIRHNVALNGGGVYYKLSSPPIRFGPKVTLEHNRASAIGGGVFISSGVSSSNPLVFETWMFGAQFFNNSARIAGGVAGWEISYPNLLKSSLTWCANCSHSASDNPASYQTLAGFGTAPTQARFTHGSCPNSVSLESNQNLTFILNLVDGFGTTVHGPPLGSSILYNTTVSAPESSTCTVFPVGESALFSNNGQVEFDGINLRGYNGNSCSIVFTTEASFVHSINVSEWWNGHWRNGSQAEQFEELHSAKELRRRAASRRDNSTNVYELPQLVHPALACNTTLNGCGPKQQIIHKDGYDACAAQHADSEVIILAVIVVVLALCLLLVFLCLICTQLRKWYRKRRLSRIVIPDLYAQIDNVTIADILGDPAIPKIPREELVIGARIGIGASGVVLQAEWNRPDGTCRDVALKEVLGLDQDWLVEIKLMSVVKHKNVVEFLGVSIQEQDGKMMCFLVTELMHQGNLRELLDKKGSNLPWKVRLKLLRDAAKGMVFLHSRKFIHRDLKPQNLLVNNRWQCKIGDFGIATIKTQQTRTMSVVGSPIYMAPEVLSKSKYGEKADVYSFGVVLVEIYTSTIPYSELHYNPPQLLSRIQAGLRPSLSGVPLPLAQLTEDCWNPIPPMRPSFAEIVVRLSRLQDLTLPASPEPTEPTPRGSYIPEHEIPFYQSTPILDSPASLYTRQMIADSNIQHRQLSITGTPGIIDLEEGEIELVDDATRFESSHSVGQRHQGFGDDEDFDDDSVTLE